MVDLGCGPGGLTATPLDHWPDARITGIDTSTEMIACAVRRRAPGRLDFEIGDAAIWRSPMPIDLLLFKASLRWIEDYGALLDHLLPRSPPRAPPSRSWSPRLTMSPPTTSCAKSTPAHNGATASKGIQKRSCEILGGISMNSAEGACSHQSGTPPTIMNSLVTPGTGMGEGSPPDTDSGANIRGRTGSDSARVRRPSRAVLSFSLRGRGLSVHASICAGDAAMIGDPKP